MILGHLGTITKGRVRTRSSFVQFQVPATTLEITIEEWIRPFTQPTPHYKNGTDTN